MEIDQIKENKLKTLLTFANPSIIAMLLQTVITVTDGYFTGNYAGEAALAAINLGLPILYFYLGVGLCVGVGGTVICGRLLGAQNVRKASEIFSQTMVTAAVLSAAVSLAVMALFTPILGVLCANEGLSAYFTQYYRVMLLCYPMMVLSSVLGMFIRVDGKPQVCMLVNIGACVLNAVLDWILMGRMNMGIFGSAVASLAVQTLAVIGQALYFVRAVSFVRFRRGRFDRAVCKEALLNGSSEFIGELASAIAMFAFNYVLLKYVGIDGVAAFSVLGFAVYGYSMIVIGFGQGLTAPASFLWGAREWETAVALRRLTSEILLGVGVLFAALFWFFGRSYAELFGCGSAVADMVSAGFHYRRRGRIF